MFTPPSLCTCTYPKLCSSLSPPFLLSRASRPGSIDDRFDEFGNCKVELELAGNAASHCQRDVPTRDNSSQCEKNSACNYNYKREYIYIYIKLKGNVFSLPLTWTTPSDYVRKTE